MIFTTDRLDKQATKTISSIWLNTFYPYKLYLPLSESDFNRLNTDMPNLVIVPVNPLSSQTELIDVVLERCDSEYIAIVPSGFPIKDTWIENPLYALINNSVGHEGFVPDGSTDRLWAAVVRKDDLQRARRSFPNLPVRESLKAAGIVLRHPSFEELPFQFDNLLQQARSSEKEGAWSEAAQMFEYIADHHQNELWMKRRAAKAFFKASEYKRAVELSLEVNQQRPTVDTLLLEAKVKRQQKNFDSAIKLLKTAEQILEEPIAHLISHSSCSEAQIPGHE